MHPSWYSIAMSIYVLQKGKAMSERHFDVVLPEEVVAGFGWAEERYQRACGKHS
jgi:hypothetical protein